MSEKPNIALGLEPLPAGNDGGRKLDPLMLIQKAFEFKWLILSITLTFTVASAFSVFRQPDVYQATSVIQVKKQDQNLVKIEDVAAQDLRTLDELNTIVEKITHSVVLKKVVHAENLTAHEAFLKADGSTVSTNVVVGRLQKMVSANLKTSTRLVDIRVEHTDPELAFTLANVVAEQFIRHNVDEKLEANRSGNLVLVEEAKRLKKRLQESEQRIQEYRETHNAVSLEDKENIVLEKLKSLNKQYTDAKASRLQMGTDLEQVKNLGGDPSALFNLASVRDDAAVQSVHGKVLEQEALVTSYTNRYLPKYPKMIQARKDLNDLKNRLNSVIVSAAGTLQSSYDNALAREKSFEEALSDAEKQSLELNRLAIQYNVLNREIESDRALYDSVLRRLKETDLTKGLERNAILLTEEASLPKQPFKPNRLRSVINAFVAGLFVSFLLVSVISYFDNTIKTVDQAETELDFPVLGAVPEDKQAKERDRERLVTIENPDSTCTEAYRSLRAAVQMLGRESEQRVVLFTSAVPSEGKTFNAINYSVTLAQQGYKTLLIDFDLRRPAMGESFDIPKDESGVSDYFVGRKSLEEICLDSVVDNSALVVAGPRVPNPSEQLANEEVLTQLLSQALEKYDRVVLDTPPLNAVADTVYLLNQAQVVCLVVRAGKTPKKAVRRAIQQMERSGRRPSGVVLNFLPEHTGYGYYYYYSHNNYYGSKGVYGSEEDRKAVRSKKTRKRRHKDSEQSDSVG